MESFSRSKIIETIELFYIGVEKTIAEQPQNTSKLILASKSLATYLQLSSQAQKINAKTLLPLLQNINDSNLQKYIKLIIDEIKHHDDQLQLAFTDEDNKRNFFEFISAQIENISPKSDARKAPSQDKLDLSALNTETLSLFVLLYQREIYITNKTEADKLFLEAKVLADEISDKIKELTEPGLSEQEKFKLQTAIDIAKTELTLKSREFIEKYHKAISIIENIPYIQRNKTDYINWIDSLEKLADWIFDEDPAKSFKYYEASWKIRTDTPKNLLSSNNENEVPLLQKNMFIALNNAIYAITNDGNNEVIYAAINRYLDYYEKNPSALPHELHFTIIDAFKLKGDMLKASDPSQAFENYQAALSLLKPNNDQDQGKITTLTFASITCLENLIEKEISAQQFRNAYLLISEARQLLANLPETVIPTDDEQKILDSLGQLYFDLINALIEENNFDVAKKILTKLIKYQEKYINGPDTLDKPLIVSIEQLISAYQRLNKTDPDYKEKSKEALRLLAQMRKQIFYDDLLEPLENKHRNIFNQLNKPVSSLFSHPRKSKSSKKEKSKHSETESLPPSKKQSPKK